VEKHGRIGVVWWFNGQDKDSQATDPVSEGFKTIGETWSSSDDVQQQATKLLFSKLNGALVKAKDLQDSGDEASQRGYFVCSCRMATGICNRFWVAEPTSPTPTRVAFTLGDSFANL
jgi:hypothetical protein